jgi:hypothetical protein
MDRLMKAAAALEVLKSVGVPQKQIAMVAGGVLDREEVRKRKKNARARRSRRTAAKR